MTRALIDINGRFGSDFSEMSHNSLGPIIVGLG